MKTLRPKKIQKKRQKKLKNNCRQTLDWYADLGKKERKKMTEDGLKSVIVKVGLTALVLACVGGVKDKPSNKPSDNRNTTVQVIEAADEEDESCNDAIGTYCGFVDGNAAKLNLMENQKFSMSVSDDSKIHTTTGEYSISNETLNLKEDSGKEFALAFDGKNAILNTEETYMLFSADTATGSAEQA